MATTSLQVNGNNDLYLPDGRNLSVLSGVAACSQDIRLKTLMRLGEDIYNTANGVDYFGTIFTPQRDYDAARKSLSDAILSCPDVLNIDSLTIGVVGEVFSYTANVMTIYGPLTVTNS